MFSRRGSDNPLQARIQAINAQRGRPGAAAPARPEAAATAAAPPRPRLDDTTLESARALVQPAIEAVIDLGSVPNKVRSELARQVEEITQRTLDENHLALQPNQFRDLVSLLVTSLVEAARARPQQRSQVEAVSRTSTASAASRASIDDAIPRIYPLVMERIDTEVAAKLKREELARQLAGVVAEVLVEQKIQLNSTEQRDLVVVLLNDMLGFGPLEPLLADETVNDIMVNGAKQVYVERRGKLELTDVTFRDNAARHEHRDPHRHHDRTPRR